MAIHHTGAQTETATQPSVSPQMNYTQAPQQLVDDSFSFHGSSLIASPINENPGSDRLITLDNNISKALADNAHIEFRTFRMEAGQSNENGVLGISMLVIAGALRSNPKMVGYHTLILDGSGEPLQPKIHQIGGENVEEIITASVGYDHIAQRLIEATVRSSYKGVDAFSADSEVVPANFNVNVGENDEPGRLRIQRLAANIAIAIATELTTRQPNFPGLNMKKWSRDSNLVVTPRFERGTVSGVDELPRRQDIRIELSSQQQRQQNQQNYSINNGDRTIQIAQSSAFVDFLYAPVQPQGAYAPVNPSAPNYKYAANIIVTAMQSPKVTTVGGYLLNLACIRAITEGNGWYHSFRSNGMRNSMSDIGFLNIEANIENDPSGVGRPIDTAMDSFGPAQQQQYLNSIIRPGAVISIDVPESGPETWALAAFSIASSNHPQAKAAQQYIYQQANLLTGGQFGLHFNDNDDMFVNTGNRVHMGYYRDSQDRLRDIREIDYVSIAAFSKDIEQIKLWSDTYTAVSIPLLVRLARRKRMIMSVAGSGDPKFTGYANRVTFSKKFTDALTASLAAIGVTPRLDNNAFGLQIVDRGVASWVDNAAFNPVVGGFFSQNMGSGGGYNTYAPFNPGRF